MAGITRKNKKKNSRKAEPKHVTEEQLRLMLSSFRDNYGHLRQASEWSGVSVPTARKFWKEGYPHAKKPIPPAKQTIDSEMRTARGAAVDIETEVAAREAEKVRNQVIQTRKEESELVGASRRNITMLIQSTGDILEGALKQAADLRKALETGVDPSTGKTIPFVQRIDAMWKIARLVKQASDSSKDVIQMERLLLGEPTSIMGVKDIDQISEEEAIDKLDKMSEVARRVKERRERLAQRKSELKVLPGGKSDAS